MSVPPISRPLLLFFRRIVRGYFHRHFHAVRIAHVERMRATNGPLIVYANHSSWWDPMVCFLLAEKLLPNRRHYAPMDSSALEKYGILKKIGIFPVEMERSRGAIQFLRTGEAILQQGGVLWVTPQGRFCDPRERPLKLKPGMATLAARVAAMHGCCTLLPLAIEYPFWDERLPETLLYLAEPLQIEAGQVAEEIQVTAAAALQEAMNQMEQLALARNAAGFDLLAGGSLGAGGFYGIGHRIIAFLKGRPYIAEHTPLANMQRGTTK